jgi:DNA polymerase III subunit delta'
MNNGYLPQLPWHAAAWHELQPLRARGVHAVLLHGAAGIGKKSLAIDLARALLCETPQASSHACGVCAGCQLTGAGSHPDLRIVVPDTMAAWRGTAADEEGDADEVVHEDIDPDANGEPAGKAKRASREIRIEQVRALADFVTTSTHRGGSRVVMLAPAEALNTASANALLKMLEEPPAGSLFVLATDALDDVLPTIRSRCVLVRVAAPAPSQTVSWLKLQSVEDAETALAEAGGAPLLALAQAGGAGLDPELRSMLAELLARGAQLSSAEVAARVPKTVPVGPALALFQRWGWDLLALSTVRAPTAVRYHPRQSAVLARVSAQSEPAALLAWLGRLAGYRSSQDHPLNPRLVIEAALLDYIACFQRTDATGGLARAAR